MRIFVLALVVGGAFLALFPEAAQADVTLGPISIPTRARSHHPGAHQPVYRPCCPGPSDYYTGVPVYRPRCLNPCGPTLTCRPCGPRACDPCTKPWRRGRLRFRWRRAVRPSTYAHSHSYPGAITDFGGATVVRTCR
jgi:hypothetical protein